VRQLLFGLGDSSAGNIPSNFLVLGHVFEADLTNSAVLCWVLVGLFGRVAVISAKNHERQRRKRQSVAAKREKSQTPKVLTAILTFT